MVGSDMQDWWHASLTCVMAILNLKFEEKMKGVSSETILKLFDVFGNWLKL